MSIPNRIQIQHYENHGWLLSDTKLTICQPDHTTHEFSGFSIH